MNEELKIELSPREQKIARIAEINLLQKQLDAERSQLEAEKYALIKTILDEDAQAKAAAAQPEQAKPEESHGE